MGKAASDPAAAAEFITVAVEGCRSWPQALQAWVLSCLQKEGGLQELMSAMVEHHSKKEDPDPNRACPGASAEFKAKVQEALAASNFEARVRAQFKDQEKDSRDCST